MSEDGKKDTIGEREVIEEIFVLRKKSCPEKQSAVKVGATWGSSILAIGLLTALFWRLITYYHDKVEFEKFKKELQDAKWQGVSFNVFFSRTDHKVLTQNF